MEMCVTVGDLRDCMSRIVVESVSRVTIAPVGESSSNWLKRSTGLLLREPLGLAAREIAERTQRNQRSYCRPLSLSLLRRKMKRKKSKSPEQTANLNCADTTV